MVGKWKHALSVFRYSYNLWEWSCVKCWGIVSKALPMWANPNIFHWNGQHMEACSSELDTYYFNVYTHILKITRRSNPFQSFTDIREVFYFYVSKFMLERLAHEGFSLRWVHLLYLYFGEFSPCICWVIKQKLHEHISKSKWGTWRLSMLLWGQGQYMRSTWRWKP